MRYIAFLRGINVGGKNLIKMDALKGIFISLDFEDVSTFIASGNVIFDSAGRDSNKLTKKIEGALIERYNTEIKVMLRTYDEVRELVQKNPFKALTQDKRIKHYVCFLYGVPTVRPVLPVISEKERLEIFEIDGHNAFLISREIKNGRYGFPANFIEKEFGVACTARNWNTVCKLIK